MKATFIIFLIVYFSFVPGWMKASDLKEQNSAVEQNMHIIAKLTCQSPQIDITTGNYIEPSNPIYKNSYSPREAVWVAVNLENHPGKKARIYVIKHTGDDWPAGLKDDSGGYEVIDIPEKGNGLIYEKVWDAPIYYQKGYDVVVDFEPFGYDKGQDIVDGIEQEGFFVPKKWINLENIYFNHNANNNPNFKCDCKPRCFDAIDTKINYNTDIRVPEWKKGESSHPAAYHIQNSYIVVFAEFLASQDVFTSPKLPRVWIGADSKVKEERLGNIKPKHVEFRKNSSGEYASGKLPFCVSLFPKVITKFYQEWHWYWIDQDNNKIPFNVSKNKIYIILKYPQTPWKKKGKSIPWIDVLDLACSWTAGESTKEGAAHFITKYLYNDLGGIYDYTPRYTYSSCNNFDLKRFMEKVPNIDSVNCYDMGKALVTFANIVGCDLTYTQSNSYIRTKRIKPIGTRGRYRHFRSHAYGSFGDNFFDATFKVYKGCTQLELLTNLSWCNYRKKVIKEGGRYYPQPHSFGLGDRDLSCINDLLKKRVEWVKEKYSWPLDTGIVVTDIDIQIRNLLELHFMKKTMGESTHNKERIQNTIYIVHNWWGFQLNQIEVRMVEAPSMAAAKKYLIYYYADTSQTQPEIKKTVAGIGNICFVGKKKKNGFSNLDFIRHNILFNIQGKGRIRKKLREIALMMDLTVINKASLR